ncbi:MAG TPA: hypothetical protein VHZ24_17740 [Pirellulales bacterium]|jgi:hypothetical protein|nr:hypothetical protein [Pirellulales bacterium]
MLRTKLYDVSDAELLRSYERHLNERDHIGSTSYERVAVERFLSDARTELQRRGIGREAVPAIG